MSPARKYRRVRVAGGVLLALMAGVAMITTSAQAPTQAVATSGQVTFAKEVAPILQKSCQNCHRPDSIGPMSLLTYEDARPWARAIKKQVSEREMPPWYIDKNVGVRHFKNDRSLSNAEIDTIVKWVDAGAPRGNPADMPPPKKFDDLSRWNIDQPDMVITLPQDLVVAAEAPDQYRDIIVDPGIKVDRYIKAIETKPIKGFKVVHHVRADYHYDDDFDFTNPDNFQGAFLNEWAVGKNADIFPEGAGRLFKAGTKIKFNLHVHSYGVETRTNVGLAIKFYPIGYVPTRHLITASTGGQNDLEIPPNTDNVRADGYTLLNKPARIMSFQPHMHNRGKAMCMEAIYPGGRRVETLSCVDRYRFGWHIVYLYEDDEQPLLPAGTLLHVIGWTNNTASNRYNADPDNWITHGQRTVDEMSFSWVSYYYMTEDEYKQALEERRAKEKRITTTQQP